MDIFKTINELSFPTDKYVIVGSGIMIALGLKEATDLDIEVSQDLFEECKNGAQIRVLAGYVFINSLFEGIPLTLEIDGNRMPLHHIQSLHQLQNLYFALTGEELTVTL